MIMKNILKYVAIASAVAFGFSSCVEKAPEYEPADPAGTAEVFFAPDLPSSYDLKDNPGKFSFDISRVDVSGALTVNLSTSADAIFSVPSSVSFSSGAKTSHVEVTFNPEDLEEDTPYKFTVTITNETTPYAASEYIFTASIPAAWQVFGKGTLYECPDWWNEAEEKTLYYQVLADGTYIMKIPDCFGSETIKAGGSYKVQDYIFYFDPETNYCSVPAQYMGFDDENYGQYWFGDNAGVYELYSGPRADGMSWDEYLRSKDYYMPYYDDVKGIFYLADQYFYGPEPYSSHWGYGQWDLTPDSFWLDGFVRVTDYNDDDHFGSSSALYDGVLSSMMFSDGDEPVEFVQSMRYDADYEFDPETYDPEEEGIITTTYYLSDYFAEGRCLAFVAPIPELLEDGSEISDGDNEQNSGVKVFGHDLYVNIKKGSVSFPESEVQEGEESEEDLLPTFTLVVNAYTKDAEDNVEFEFGTLTEVFTALGYGRDFYTVDDVYGGYKEDYVGTWSMFSTQPDGDYNYEVVITDEGQDEEGNEILKIKNLSGFDGWNGMVDELYAVWDNYVLDVPGQNLENPVNYEGDDYTVGVYPADPDTQAYYGQQYGVMAGICTDGALAFVNAYTGVNLSGFYYQLEGLGGLTLIGKIYGFPAGGESLGRVRNFYEEAKARRVSGPVASASVKFSGMRMVRKSAASAPVRRVNVNNFVKPEKKTGNETLAVPRF